MDKSPGGAMLCEMLNDGWTATEGGHRTAEEWDAIYRRVGQ